MTVWNTNFFYTITFLTFSTPHWKWKTELLGMGFHCILKQLILNSTLYVFKAEIGSVSYITVSVFQQQNCMTLGVYIHMKIN